MLSTVLLIILIFVLAVLLVLIYIHGTKNRNQKLVDEMEKKQQELLVLQVDVQDMLLVMQTYIDESKAQMEKDRKRVEDLIRKFEILAENRPLVQLESAPEAMNISQKKKEAQPGPKAKATKPDFSNISRIEEHILAAEKSAGQPGAPKEDEDDKSKYQRAKQMILEGKTVDQVAKELNLSQGEASFLKHLSVQK